MTTTDKQVNSQDVMNLCFSTEHMLRQSGANVAIDQTLFSLIGRVACYDHKA